MPLKFIAASLLNTCCILSFSDLKDNIRYVDRQHGFFITLQNNRFNWGYVLSPPPSRLGDVLQVSGKTRDCSTQTFSCLEIAYFEIH
jgi:hypothetical protein